MVNGWLCYFKLKCDSIEVVQKELGKSGLKYVNTVLIYELFKTYTKICEYTTYKTISKIKKLKWEVFKVWDIHFCLKHKPSSWL